MFVQHSRSNSPTKVKPKIALKLDKIRNMVSRALGEMQADASRSKVSISTSLSKRKSYESSECQEIEEVLKNLRRGYLVLKHAVSSETVGYKFVFTSQDGRSLCWKSLDREDEKRIDLISISQVVREGAEFYVKGTKVKDIRRCLVILSQSKKLQLQMSSEIEADYLKYELERAVIYSRNMRLNYKYNKL